MPATRLRGEARRSVNGCAVSVRRAIINTALGNGPKHTWLWLCAAPRLC